MRMLRAGVEAVLEVFLPERCQTCGAAPWETEWGDRGEVVRGLRSLDRPHLCAGCAESLRGEVVTRRQEEMPLVGGGEVDGELVSVLGAWKYHGLRGLAWPLAGRLAPAVATATGIAGAVDGLVPIPLHGRRRRWRGFNQAELLARLVAPAVDANCVADALRRRRATSQQARIDSGSAARQENVAGAFLARDPRAGEGRRIGLIDDVITSGATVAAAAAALRSAGWLVVWAAAVGLVEGRVDGAAVSAIRANDG